MGAHLIIRGDLLHVRIIIEAHPWIMYSVQHQLLLSHPYLAKHSELACTAIAGPSLSAFVIAAYAHL
jgi:hypothetical protein